MVRAGKGRLMHKLSANTKFMLVVLMLGALTWWFKFELAHVFILLFLTIAVFELEKLNVKISKLLDERGIFVNDDDM